MAYFEDLTPYSYRGEYKGKKILNIGWLSINESFRAGKVPSKFLKMLSELTKEPVNLCRGVHYCEFCPLPEFERIPNKIVNRVVKDCPNGNGEIWISGSNGIVYVAPFLVFHYVKVHKYLPPEEFINAVLQVNA